MLSEEVMLEPPAILCDERRSDPGLQCAVKAKLVDIRRTLSHVDFDVFDLNAAQKWSHF